MEFAEEGSSTYGPKAIRRGESTLLSTDENDEIHQAIADKIVQRLIQSNIPMQITINPSGVSAPYGGLHSMPPAVTHKKNAPCAAIIGLMAFGMTTVLLNLVNIGKYELGSVLPGMAIPFGGLAQLIAGILEYFNGNNFGCIAFVSYGSFWLSLTFVWILPPTNVINASSGGLIGAYLFLWGFFTLAMLVCTFWKNVALVVVFSSLVLLFFLLGIAEMTGNTTMEKVAAVVGIICGCSAMYTSIAELLENQFGRELLPLIKLPPVRE